MGKSSQAKTRAEVNKALEMFAESPALTFADVSRALGYESGKVVSNWYQRNTQGFRDKYDALLKIKFAELEAPAIVSLGDLVAERNFHAVKYVLDNRGYKPVEKVEANISTDIVINIEE